MRSYQLDEAKIFYLFMKVDGNIAPEEDERFKTILNEMKATDSEKDQILKVLETVDLRPYSDNSFEVCLKIGEILDNENNNFSFLFSNINNDKKERYFTVWTLINLGYADKEYTAPEKKVVDHLIERWKIEPAIAAEMIDTAETMLALTKEKEWIKTTNKSYDQKSAVIKKIDEDIKRMFNNMATTIAEAEIAIAE